MLAFIGALNRGGLLRHTITRERDAGTLTLNHMLATASSYVAADDVARAALQAVAVPNQKKAMSTSGKILLMITTKDPTWWP
jgi:acetyl-CoA acetyltransferase